MPTLPFFRLPDPLAEFTGAFVLNTVVCGSTALLIAMIACRLWRHRSAADHHTIWVLALFLGTTGPLLTTRVASRAQTSLPSWIEVEYDLTNPPTDTQTLVPGLAAHLPPSQLPQARGWVTAASLLPDTVTLPAPPLRWLGVVVIGGTLIHLLRSLHGHLLLRRVRRHSTPVSDAAWAALLREARQRLGVRRAVELRTHPACNVPLTWGHVRPVVLLPAMASAWSEDRRRTVLLHEMAHIRRWDCLTQRLAELLRTITWFHPLAWVAIRNLRLTREHACDDLVLGCGTKASDYAEHLVELAEAAASIPQRHALPMAQSCQLSRRVAAVLDLRRARRLSPGLLILVGGLLAATPAIPRPRLTADAEPPAPPPVPTHPFASPGVKLIQEHLDEAKRKVESLERQLDQLGSEHPLSDPIPEGQQEPESHSGKSRLSRIVALEVDAQAQLVRATARLERLKALAPDALREAVLSSFPDDRRMQQLGVLHATASVDAEIAASLYGPDHPERRAAEQRVRILERKLALACDGVLRGLEVQIAAFRAELDHLERQASDARKSTEEQTSAQRKYLQTKRALENARLMVDVLTRKLAQELFDSRFPGGAPIPGNPTP